MRIRFCFAQAVPMFQGPKSWRDFVTRSCHGAYRNIAPTLQTFQVWMSNAERPIAENHYQFVRDKVQSGDAFWQDYLEMAVEIMRKRFPNDLLKTKED